MMNFENKVLRKHAEKFSKKVFQENIVKIIEENIKEKKS